MLGYDKWDNQFIKEDVKRDVNFLIVEELGVSSRVSSAADYITKRIEEEYPKIKSTPLSDGVGYRDIVFIDKIFNEDITFFVRVYLFKNTKYYDKFVKEYGESVLNNANSLYGKQTLPYSKHTINAKTVSVNASCISGRIDKDRLTSSLSHELRHVYEQAMQNKRFSSRKDNTLYISSSAILNSPNFSETKRLIAYCIYMSFDYEQRATIQDFHDKAIKVLETEGSNKLNDYLSENDVVHTLMKMKYVKEQLSSNRAFINEFEEISDTIKLNVWECIKWIDNGFSFLSKKFGKAIIAIRNDEERIGVNMPTLERTNELNGNYKI